MTGPCRAGGLIERIIKAANSRQKEQRDSDCKYVSGVETGVHQ